MPGPGMAGGCVRMRERDKENDDGRWGRRKMQGSWQSDDSEEKKSTGLCLRTRSLPTLTTHLIRALERI